MRWVRQVATMWKRRNGYRILARNLKRSLGIKRHVEG
jgi:hypothetical protein